MPPPTYKTFEIPQGEIVIQLSVLICTSDTSCGI
jgi:hypothetical protein